MIYRGKSHAWGRSLSAIVFSSMMMTVPCVTAAGQVQHQIDPFMKSVKETPYTFNFLVKGLSSVHQIQFKKGVTNQYQPFFNRIVLSMTMNDGGNRIKKLEKLGDSDFGTLAHEAFHAYFANTIKVEPRFESHKAFLERRAMNLYQEIPENKRAVTLEEAYASFIGWLLQSHAYAHRSLTRPVEGETRDRCENRLKILETMWARSWEAEINGYWYKDGILEYWGEQARGLGVLITDGVDAWKDFQNQDGAHMVKEDLQELDRRWIGNVLFEGKLRKSFNETFASELAGVDCSSLPAAAENLE